MNRNHSVIFEIASKYCISDSFVDHDGYSISSKGFLLIVVDIKSSELNSPIPVHFSSLIPKMLIFTLPSPLDLFQFTLIYGPNIPGSYAILLFTTFDIASITSQIHNWVLFLFWLRLFILSGLISPLISSSILGTYQAEEFIPQRPIFLPFHAVHAVLKARTLKWFAILFSRGPCFVRSLIPHFRQFLFLVLRRLSSFTSFTSLLTHVHLLI